jgi:hypothetical protein
MFAFRPGNPNPETLGPFKADGVGRTCLHSPQKQKIAEFSKKAHAPIRSGTNSFRHDERSSSAVGHLTKPNKPVKLKQLFGALALAALALPAAADHHKKAKESQKDIVETAVEAGQWEIAMTREEESDRLAAIQERGVTVTELTDEQYQSFVDATESVYEKWAPRIGEDLVNAAQAAIDAR